MSFTHKNRRGIFGKARCVSLAVFRIFRKIEQVNKLARVLKSSTPKDTEVIVPHGRNGF
jgi:hypothetical protein